MNETNSKLCRALQMGDHPKLAELGFKKQTYEFKGFTDVDWTYQNDNFRIVVDAYFEVRLYRKNPDSDGIVQMVETISELQDVVYWIGDE